MKLLLLPICVFIFSKLDAQTAAAPEKTPEEKRRVYDNTYNKPGKKASKNFPGAYYFIPGTVGEILNQQIFSSQVTECDFMGKKFKTIDASERNYIPKNILSWGGYPYKIDRKAMVIESAAGNLIRAVITDQERQDLELGKVNINTILAYKREIEYRDRRISDLMNLTPTKGRDNFVYICTCAGYLNFAIDAKADKLPIGQFSSGMNIEKTKKSSVYLLEGNFRSPLFNHYNRATPNLQTLIDLWSWYVRTSGLDDGESILSQNLYYINEMTGLLASHSKSDVQNIKLEASLKVEVNAGPASVNSSLDFGGDQKESFTGNNWRTLVYEEDPSVGKYSIRTERLPSIVDTKQMIEQKVFVETKELPDYKALANNSVYKFSVWLLGLNEKICTEGNAFEYQHQSGDVVWSNPASVAVRSAYDKTDNKCICEISGSTKNNISPTDLNTTLNYTWEFKLIHNTEVKDQALEFKGSNSESTTAHPIVSQQLDDIIKNGTSPQMDGSMAFIWNIPLDIFDDDRLVDRTPGLTATFNGTPSFGSPTADANLISQIRPVSLVYQNGKYNLSLILKNVDMSRFTYIPTSVDPVSGTVKANVKLATGAYTTVELKNIKISIPKYLDSDNDGIPDFRDLCPNLSGNNNADSDGDGIGDSCDLCPNTPNLTQNIDTDKDGIGDICDECKTDPKNECVSIIKQE